MGRNPTGGLLMGSWLGILATAVSGTALGQSGGDSSCFGSGPLFSTHWDVLSLPEPVDSLEWKLPLSPGHPERLTEARVKMSFTQSSVGDGQWLARLDFSFPDPKPFGIPFTFQALELAWHTPAGPLSARVDWSNGCTQVGRSLFPRGSFSATVELPGMIGQSDLQDASFRIWGSRN